MPIDAITFEIRDFNTGIANEFVVENTESNYEMIASHRQTRDIHFSSMFDFEFERKECVPTFILFGAAVADSLIENENVIEIDDIDEMVGIYA